MGSTERGPYPDSRHPPLAMVGRETERALLHEQLQALERGPGMVVVLGGEAGIGKTTLAHDLMHRARERGYQVLLGRSFDLASSSPYSLWLDLATHYERTRAAGDDPDLPPVLAQRDVGLIRSQSGFFEQVRQFFYALADRHPCLVVLEDVHWADPESLALLRYVAAGVALSRVLLVMTYRVDALTQQHPFYEILPYLVRESDGLRLDLKPLSEAELGKLVAIRYDLAEMSSARLTGYLSARSDGNPFYAMELLHALETADQPGLVQTPAGWHLGNLDSVAVPDLVRQVIDLRFRILGSDLRDALAVAAVIGQEVPLDLWAEVAGLDEASLWVLIDRAVMAFLLTTPPDGRVANFVHALTRETLYAGISPPRRRFLHRAVAEALCERPGVDPDQVAFHFRGADDSRAVEWLIRAGDRAQRAYAWLTAGERFLSAAAMLPDVPESASTRARLLYRYGRLQRYSNAADGIESLGTARKLAEAAGEHAVAADAEYSQGLLRCFADDWLAGVAGMIAGIEELEALPVDLARPSWSTVDWMADSLPSTGTMDRAEPEPLAGVLTGLGISHRRGGLPWFLATAGRVSDAEAEGERFLGAIGDRETGPLVLSASGHSRFGLGMAHAAMGRPALARRCFDEARLIYDRLDHHAVIAFIWLTELLDVMIPFAGADRPGRLQVAMEAQRALERAGGALLSEGVPRRAHLVNLYFDGEWQQAIDLSEHWRGYGNYVLRRQLTWALAPIALHRGDTTSAWEHVHRILPQGMQTEPGDAVFADAVMLQVMAARLSLVEGHLAAAREWMAVNDRWLAWGGTVAGMAGNALGWAEVEQAAGNLTRARGHAENSVRLASSPEQPLALLTALRTRGVIRREQGEIAGAEQDVRDALDLATTCDMPFERAQVMLELVSLLMGRDDHEARQFADDARVIGDKVGAKPLLARLAKIAGPSQHQQEKPFGLTARELDVLRLAAEGLTDIEIADRLFISSRTVSQHLHSVYGKLQVRTRVEASRFAMEHHLL